MTFQRFWQANNVWPALKQKVVQEIRENAHLKSSPAKQASARLSPGASARHQVRTGYRYRSPLPTLTVLITHYGHAARLEANAVVAGEIGNSGGRADLITCRSRHLRWSSQTCPAGTKHYWRSAERPRGQCQRFESRDNPGNLRRRLSISCSLSMSGRRFFLVQQFACRSRMKGQQRRIRLVTLQPMPSSARYLPMPRPKAPSRR